MEITMTARLLRQVLTKVTNEDDPSTNLCRTMNTYASRNDLSRTQHSKLCNSVKVDVDDVPTSVCKMSNTGKCNKKSFMKKIEREDIDYGNEEIKDRIESAIEEKLRGLKDDWYDDEDDDWDDDDDDILDDDDDDDDVDDDWMWMDEHDDDDDDDTGMGLLLKGEYLFSNFATMPKKGLLQVGYDRMRDYLSQFDDLEDKFTGIENRRDAIEIVEQIPFSHRKRAALIAKMEGPTLEEKLVMKLFKLAKKTSYGIISSYSPSDGMRLSVRFQDKFKEAGEKTMETFVKNTTKNLENKKYTDFFRERIISHLKNEDLISDKFAELLEETGNHQDAMFFEVLSLIERRGKKNGAVNKSFRKVLEKIKRKARSETATYKRESK